MLRNLAMVIAKAKQAGDMATPDQVVGMQNLAQHITQHIQIVAQDKNEKERVKKWGDALGKLMNLVKAFAQRLQEQQKQQAQQGPQMDPKDMAKLQGMKMLNEAKAANTRESHAQRTAQRQVQFEMEMRQKQQESQQDLQRQNADLQKEVAQLQMQLKGKQAEHHMALRAKHAEHRLNLGVKHAETQLDLRKKREETDIDIEAQKKLAKIKPKKASD
jgi:hypothetical protein